MEALRQSSREATDRFFAEEGRAAGKPQIEQHESQVYALDRLPEQGLEAAYFNEKVTGDVYRMVFPDDWRDFCSWSTEVQCITIS